MLRTQCVVHPEQNPPDEDIESGLLQNQHLLRVRQDAQGGVRICRSSLAACSAASYLSYSSTLCESVSGLVKFTIDSFVDTTGYLSAGWIWKDRSVQLCRGFEGAMSRSRLVSAIWKSGCRERWAFWQCQRQTDLIDGGRPNPSPHLGLEQGLIKAGAQRWHPALSWGCRPGCHLRGNCKSTGLGRASCSP